VADRAQHRELNAWLIALGGLGLLSGVGVSWVASRAVVHPSKIPSLPVILLVAWSFIGSGLLSWRARPDNRLGPVMVLTGFTWFASVLEEGNNSVVATIGSVFAVAFLAGFLYIGLSFPSGRLPTALDRALVAVALGLVTVVQLAWLLCYDPTCDRCVANLLEVTRDDALANALVQFQRIAGLAVIAVAVGLLAVRLVRSSRPQRHTVIPVLLAEIVALTVFAASVVVDALHTGHSEAYGHVAGYAFAVVPVAILVAFLQRQLARGAGAGGGGGRGGPTPPAAPGRWPAPGRARGDT